jgi:hypothetical protein
MCFVVENNLNHVVIYLIWPKQLGKSKENLDDQ